MLNGTRVKDGAGYARYITSGEGKGEWLGNAAERLGLAGEVLLDPLTRVATGLHPATGEKLTQRLKDDREAGIDYTFSAPKSASVMALVAGDERVTEAFAQAVRETAAVMERNLMVRVRRFGQMTDRENPEMLAGLFIHDRTRKLQGESDPQLHAHLFVVNQTFDRHEGKWKAAKQHFLMKEIPYYQADFQMRFADKLAGLGYGIRKTQHAFEIEGVSEKLIRDFSRSTSKIDSLAEEMQATPAQKATIGPRTRGRKSKETREELQKGWRASLQPEQREELAAVRGSASGRTERREEVLTVDVRKAWKHERDVMTAKRLPVEQVPVKRLAASLMRDFYGKANPEQVAFAIRSSGLKIKAGMASHPKPKRNMVDRVRRSIYDRIAASRRVVVEQVQRHAMRW